jgi:hypothetical protein
MTAALAVVAETHQSKAVMVDVHDCTVQHKMTAQVLQAPLPSWLTTWYLRVPPCSPACR